MDKSVIDQFKADMNSAVALWKTEELALYNTFPREIWIGEYWNIIKPTLEKFPDFIWELWFAPLDEKNSKLFMYGTVNREAIKKAIAESLFDAKSSADKGLIFEEIGRDIRNEVGSLIREIGRQWLGSENAFSHTGPKMYREDFGITKRYTIDFKYSEIKDKSKYRDIIKTAGKTYYKNINDLREGIMRSLYSVGKNYGEGQLFKFDQGSFQELKKPSFLTDSLIWQQHHSKNIPDPRRKILIYLFQDGGRWASQCLEDAIEWAAQELESGRFDTILQKKGYVPAKEFWKFTNYGTRTKDDSI